MNASTIITRDDREIHVAGWVDCLGDEYVAEVHRAVYVDSGLETTLSRRELDAAEDQLADEAREQEMTNAIDAAEPNQ